ncbi:hypothetical protein chiPu_0022329 [Chiloscyllium punctatum]|uniref:Uncharacterized protein n=1 Tax=Chiloscyllium punctatum TaxID=137246 RepID=A0A401RIF0_CHIPU|nr:hypothetical protein [Chiloscyllium punctatum]
MLATSAGARSRLHFGEKVPWDSRIYPPPHHCQPNGSTKKHRHLWALPPRERRWAQSESLRHPRYLSEVQPTVRAWNLLPWGRGWAGGLQRGVVLLGLPEQEAVPLSSRRDGKDINDQSRHDCADLGLPRVRPHPVTQGQAPSTLPGSRYIMPTAKTTRQ